MITREDLIEAIAECQGTRNPNSHTCMMLAAFYTILDHMDAEERPENIELSPVRYSMAAVPSSENVIGYYGDSDFLIEAEGKAERHVMLIMDDLMNAISVLQPKLYSSVMKKIAE